MKTRQIHGLGLGEFLIFAPAKEMLKSAYFFSALGTQNGFLQTIFSLVWMGFDNEAHYFFSTDLQRLEKNRVQKEGQRSPSGAKVGYFLKKKCFL